MNLPSRHQTLMPRITEITAISLVPARYIGRTAEDTSSSQSALTADSAQKAWRGLCLTRLARAALALLARGLFSRQ